METIGKRRGETKGVSSNEKRIKFEKGFEKNCSNSARDITTKTSTPFVFPYIILQIVFPYIILQIVFPYIILQIVCVSVHNPTDCLCFRT